MDSYDRISVLFNEIVRFEQQLQITGNRMEKMHFNGMDILDKSVAIKREVAKLDEIKLELEKFKVEVENIPNTIDLSSIRTDIEEYISKLNKEIINQNQLLETNFEENRVLSDRLLVDLKEQRLEMQNSANIVNDGVNKLNRLIDIQSFSMGVAVMLFIINVYHYFKGA